MASPFSDTWWSNFLDQHGRDSEEEAAFLGYLTTQGIASGSEAVDLQAAYEQFVTFIDESTERAAADPGPSAEELAKERAAFVLQTVAVPRSRVSDPLVQKPFTAATRPKALRKSPDEAGVPQYAEAAAIPDPRPIPGTPPRGAAVPGPATPTQPPGPGDPPKPESDEPSPQPGLRRR